VKDWIWRWGPAVLVMAVIFIASGTPGRELPTFGAWDLIAKKGGHMLGYALLAWAFFHALSKSKTLMVSSYIAAVFLATAYAATDEFHQKFTPGRTSSVHDVMIDAAGAWIGLALWCWLKSSNRNRRNRQSESGIIESS
jgi:VanZ family protein